MSVRPEMDGGYFNRGSSQAAVTAIASSSRVREDLWLGLSILVITPTAHLLANIDAVVANSNEVTDQSRRPSDWIVSEF